MLYADFAIAILYKNEEIGRRHRVCSKCTLYNWVIVSAIDIAIPTLRKLPLNELNELLSPILAAVNVIRYRANSSNAKGSDKNGTLLAHRVLCDVEGISKVYFLNSLYRIAAEGSHYKSAIR